MSQIITNAFASYWQECLANQTPVELDEIVLANMPNVDQDTPLDPRWGMPPADRIVHRQAVDQRGRINNDAVAYTIVMDTSLGDFEFNAMYLINKARNLVAMVVYKGSETKLKTDPHTGQVGNSLVKSMLMEYDRASEATVTNVDASTWQIDYAARLRGMDDDLRLQALQCFGPATFYGDGFKLVNEAGVYKVQPGVAYVGGLRAQLDEVKKVTPGAKPVGLWLDIYRAGSLLDAWVNHFTLTLSVPDMVDYLDSNGYHHHVAKVAIINADGSVTDVRRKRTIELSGDVSGAGILEEAQGVNIAVEIKAGSHRHPWSELDNVPAPATRWPNWDEVTDKPALATKDHTHPGNVMNPEYLANRDLNSIWLPGFYYQDADINTSAERHYPENLSGSLLVTSGAGIQQRYHVYNTSRVWTRAQYSTGAFTPWALEYNSLNKPTPEALGAMRDGGSYNSVTLSNWFRSTGATGWYNETYLGGIYMEDHTWVRVYGGKKFYVANTDADAISTSGGVFVGGTIIEGGHRVYSPNNQPHYSHLHHAAQGNADIVAGNWANVGGYVLATAIAGGSYAGPGYTIAGGNLRTANTEDDTPGIGSALPGTWMLMGAIKGSGNTDQNTSLWIRIS